MEGEHFPSLQNGIEGDPQPGGDAKVEDRGKGGWFAIVPGAAVVDGDLSHGAFRTLAAAAAYAGRERVVRVSQGFIAKRLGRKRQSVNRWFQILVRKGYLMECGQSRHKDGSRAAKIWMITGYGGPITAKAAAQEPQSRDEQDSLAGATNTLMERLQNENETVKP